MPKGRSEDADKHSSTRGAWITANGAVTLPASIVFKIGEAFDKANGPRYPANTPAGGASDVLAQPLLVCQAWIRNISAEISVELGINAYNGRLWCEGVSPEALPT